MGVAETATRATGERPAPTPPGVAVRCVGVRKTFDTGVEALKGVDLECPPSQIVVLLGPSGCGKTTLLRSIAGLEDPTEGHVEIAGRDVTRVEPQDRGVAMVFQNYGLYPDKTAFANIEFPLLMARVPKQERAGRVRDIARLLRIEDLLDRRPNRLSGGQRQRVGIGRALVRNPAVLLMDEPLSNLDAELRAQMRVELLGLQRRLGTTTIYVTHDQLEALALADRLAVMQAGAVEQVGAPHEVFNWPATRFVARFLGGMNLLPYSALSPEMARRVAGSVDARKIATVGVRPEDLRVGTGGAEDLTLCGATSVSELAGRERIVHFTVAEHDLKLRLPACDAVPTRLTASAARAALHFFDANGHRL